MDALNKYQFMIMFWFSLYHDYFITKIKHFLFPVLYILPNYFIYLHKPSTILIWPPPFNMDHISSWLLYLRI